MSVSAAVGGTSILEGGQQAITSFAAEYTPAVIAILGVTIVIGLGIWGFMKLKGLFQKSAK